MTQHALARMCGAIYLIVVGTGIFSLAYVPGQIMVAGDQLATLANIRENEALYRLGVAGLLLNQLAFFVLPLALFALLAQVDRGLAKVMVLSALAGIPLALVSAAERMVLLDLANAALPQETLVELATASRSSAGRAMLFATAFWGLWLLPFGYLVYRSGFLPRLLGIVLMLGCGGYLVNLFGLILMADYAQTAVAATLRWPATIGEIGICLWLLLLGARAGFRAT